MEKTINYKNGWLKWILMMVFFAGALFTFSAQANLHGVPAPGTRITNDPDMKCSQIIFNNNYHPVHGDVGGRQLCWLKDMTNPVKFPALLEYYSGTGIDLGGILAQDFVKTAGYYKLREYRCFNHYPKPRTCTIGKSDSYMDTIDSPWIESTEAISAQELSFGGAAKKDKLLYSFGICLALVDANGETWSSDIDPITCYDADHRLPKQSATCSISGEVNLDISLGAIERKDILATAGAGSKGNIIRDIPVICKGDGASAVETKFTYTPVAMNGEQFISTSNKDLGVALIYQGKVVIPDDPLPETFKSGTNYIHLEFQPVRDANVSPDDIATGAFRGFAIMVITAM